MNGEQRKVAKDEVSKDAQLDSTRCHEGGARKTANAQASEEAHLAKHSCDESKHGQAARPHLTTPADPQLD